MVFESLWALVFNHTDSSFLSRSMLATVEARLGIKIFVRGAWRWYLRERIISLL